MLCSFIFYKVGLYLYILLSYVTHYVETDLHKSEPRHCFRLKRIDVLIGIKSPHIDLYYNWRKTLSRLNHGNLPSNRFNVVRAWVENLEQPYIRHFPVDSNPKNEIRIVNGIIFSSVSPTPFKSQSRLIAVSNDALTECLDLDLETSISLLFINLISGNHNNELRKLLPIPLAHRYGGHQFGHWVGQLGDGRAHLIGSMVNRNKDRWEIQLKGSGQTPYSRQGDGRAVLRSSVREFLASEAMHYLGVPTSRAASLVVTDDLFARDQFYDGNVIYERGAIVMRLAPSWFRFGSLEILAKSGEFDLLRSLTDFVIDQHFPQIDSSSPDKYLMFFDEIVMSTAHMIAYWQSIGFTHGVCNTDNFSLLSITIDYGPFGFMDTYDPKFVPNTSDDEARYSYENQPHVGLYNLDKLKQALWPLWTSSQRQTAEIILRGYKDHFKSKYVLLFSKKFGLHNVNREVDEKLIELFLKIMQESKSDFTLTFRHLGDVSLEDLKDRNFRKEYWTLKLIEKHSLYETFLEMYENRLVKEGTEEHQRQLMMSKNNPRYVLRNWMAERAIAQAENNDFSGVKLLYEILKNPFSLQEVAENHKYADKPPYWASHIKISCSS